MIRSLRRATGIRTIGHNGTLDPEASGLLVLALGNATRVLPYLASEPKVYEFTIRFGATTDTLDSAGTVTAENGAIPSLEQLRDAIPHFTGTITQTPPHYSALKINGKRAYSLARQKKSFTVPAREITIHSLRLESYDPQKPEAYLYTECSGGTYIRSLCRDIAEKAGSLGYAASIRRTAIGSFHIDTAVTVDAVKEDLPKHLIPANTLLSRYPSYHATPSQLKGISHGNPITVSGLDGENLVFVYDEAQQLAAITERISLNTYHPIKVFFPS